ncbi:MAG: hypothetical protein E6H47_10525 [Betaproteobacteria bacterium]|nr:MAG: hypothetical protein E6H47_10525 [Betaproteobacteria bacterium]
MTKKSYATNVSIILGISVVLMLFLFVLVSHHRGIYERVRQDRSERLGTGSNVAERTKPASEVSGRAAQTQPEPAEKPAAAPKPSHR